MSNVVDFTCRSCKKVVGKPVEMNVRALAGHHLMSPDDQREVLFIVRVCQECLDKAEDELDGWRPWFRRLLRIGYSRAMANRLMIKAMARARGE